MAKNYSQLVSHLGSAADPKQSRYRAVYRMTSGRIHRKDEKWKRQENRPKPRIQQNLGYILMNQPAEFDPCLGWCVRAAHE